MGKPNVLVTGASTGIGYSTAQFLSDNGWHVYAGARKQKDLDKLNNMESVTPVKLDVCNEQEIRNAISLIEQNDGKLDGLVNNAGIAVTGPLMVLDSDDLQKQFNTNVFALHMVTKAAFNLLLNAKGRIINISSIAGKFSFPFMGPYCMSKHALEAYSDALRKELYTFGIKVILIEPGLIKTPIWSKADVDDVRIKGSIFGEMAMAFAKNTLESAEKEGLDPIVIARLIQKALVHRNPKDRYMKTENDFRTFIMKITPARRMDKMFSKQSTVS